MILKIPTENLNKAVKIETEQVFVPLFEGFSGMISLYSLIKMPPSALKIKSCQSKVFQCGHPMTLLLLLLL